MSFIAPANVDICCLEEEKRMTARYVQLPIFEALTGYSQKAIRRKIEEGVWLEGREFRRAPDGHILVDMEGYNKWVERGLA
jgi:hypothetical protein